MGHRRLIGTLSWMLPPLDIIIESILTGVYLSRVETSHCNINRSNDSWLNIMLFTQGSTHTKHHKASPCIVLPLRHSDSESYPQSYRTRSHVE